MGLGSISRSDARQYATINEGIRLTWWFQSKKVRLVPAAAEGRCSVAEVVDHPSTKLYVQHFRRRKNYRRLKGHRQPYTSVRIQQIVLPG